MSEMLQYLSLLSQNARLNGVCVRLLRLLWIKKTLLGIRSSTTLKNKRLAAMPEAVRCAQMYKKLAMKAN